MPHFDLVTMPHGPDLLTAVVESTSDAVFAKDLEGRYTIINTAGARFLGRGVDEILGKTDEELLTADEARMTMEADRRVLASGRTLTYEVREMWRGVWREWHSTKGVLRDAHGQIAGVFGVAREISAQRKTEQALARSEQLAAVGTLAAGVAHEINNPLAFVSGNLAYLDAELRSSPLTGPTLEAMLTAVAEARNGAERVRIIVHGLLATARVDENPVRAIDANAALERALSIISDSLRHGPRVFRDLDPLPWVMADEGRLVQVLVNLLANAVQALPDDRGHAREIRVVTRREGAERVVVEIRDNGVGIAPDHLAHIFEPFFTTKPVGEGTGLGLSIADGYIRSMGGELSVESELGVGTRVRVLLRTGEAVAESTPAVATAPTAPTGDVLRRRARVLIVDDEPHLVSALCRYFADRHDLTSCGDAAAALALLAAGSRFDLILCDLMMPGMSGSQFCEVLSATDHAQGERVVLATGGATPLDAALSPASPRRWLRKPYDLPALEALLDASALAPLRV